MKVKETLEEVAERLLNLNELDNFRDYHYKQDLYNAFMIGIKYQQETSYSEEEVLNFTQTIIQQYKFGNTNIEQMDLLKETLQLFKNKK